MKILIISTPFIQSPPPTFLMTIKNISSKPPIFTMARNYKPKVCAICGSKFVPLSGNQKYCKRCVPTSSKNKALHLRYLKKHFSERYREKRRQKRRYIQNVWGYVGGAKGTWVNQKWQKAEKYAVEALKHEGFKNVKRLSYFKQCPFDVKAEKNGEIYVFQVTMRTHIDDIKRHKQLAKDLGVKFKVIYVKPDLSGYLIKDRGMQELCLRDLKEVKSFTCNNN